MARSWTVLRVQQPLVPQRLLQRGLHLHGAEFIDGEVQVRLRLDALIGEMLAQQLREVSPEELFEKLQPFKELVAEDIKDGDDSD